MNSSGHLKRMEDNEYFLDMQLRSFATDYLIKMLCALKTVVRICSWLNVTIYLFKNNYNNTLIVVSCEHTAA